MRYKLHSSSKGVSLVELLVGIVVGLVVLLGATTAFLGVNRSVSENMKADRLNHEVQSVVDIMIEELRRAGYWNTATVASPTTNPFGTIFTGTAGCVLYSYDSNNDGVVQPAERLGFKRDGTAIWMRSSGADMANCSNADDTWERVTDETLVSVQALTFTPSSKCVNSSTKAVSNTTCAAMIPAPIAGEKTVEGRTIEVNVQTIIVSTPENIRKNVIGVAKPRNYDVRMY